MCVHIVSYPLKLKTSFLDGYVSHVLGHFGASFALLWHAPSDVAQWAAKERPSMTGGQSGTDMASGVFEPTSDANRFKGQSGTRKLKPMPI